MSEMLHTRLTELLGCRYPIVQTAMGWVADPRLVAATGNAGGFGFLAGATIPAQQMEADILRTKELSSAPFGVNFHMYQPNAAAIVDLVVKHGVRAVSYSRSPGPAFIRKLKDAGVVCMPTVGAVKHAVKAVELGADAVTVQGGEGGGHTGSVPTTLLLPDVVCRVKVPVIGVASHPSSLVMDFADIAICFPNLREACAANVAPTTSTALQLALGDALAMAVMDMRGVSTNDLRARHPGGSIGLQLTPVSEIMHGARRLPLVPADAGMPDVISKMTSGRFGVAGVVDQAGALVGLISDGDLRRRFEVLQHASAADVMTRDPRTIPADMLAADALAFLNENKITCAFILDRHDTEHAARPVGIVHIHDLLRFGFS